MTRNGNQHSQTMPLLLILILPTACFALNSFPEPDVSRVLYVYNDNSTIDTDENGTIDHWQILAKLEQMYGTLPNVLGVKTVISFNSEEQAQSSHVDQLHFDFDTSSVYGNDTAVSLAPGNQYPLQEIGAWFDADSAHRWGKVTQIELLMGMMLKTRGNAKIGLLPQDNGGMDSTLYRSFSAWLWTWLAPGCGSNGYFAGKKVWRSTQNPYKTIVDATNNWEIEPNQMYAKFGQIAVYDPPDSTRLWVWCPTLLDGNHVQDVLDMLDRSQHHVIPASGIARETEWAVMDESSGSLNYRAPYRNMAGFADTLQVTFPAQVLADVDSSSADGTDTIYVGWPGHITLPAGDSCAFYFTAASKHSPRPDESGIWFNKIQFPIVPGAFCWTPESYNSYTIRDTSLRPSGEGTQTLLCEAIHEGFTYAVGHCFEPFSGGLPQTKALVNGIRVPHLTFAQYASALIRSTMFSEVAIGNGLGYFRQALTGEGEAATFSGNCSEVVSYSATMPAGADSILFTRITDDGDTLLTLVNTSPGGSVNQSLGTRWHDKPLEKVLVTIIDQEGTYHTNEFIAP